MLRSALFCSLLVSLALVLAPRGAGGVASGVDERWSYSFRVTLDGGEPAARERLLAEFFSADLIQRKRRFVRTDSDGVASVRLRPEQLGGVRPAHLIIGDPLADTVGATLELPVAGVDGVVDAGSVRLRGWPILGAGTLETDQRTKQLVRRGLLIGIRHRTSTLSDDEDGLYIVAKGAVGDDGSFLLRGPRLLDLDEEYVLFVPVNSPRDTLARQQDARGIEREVRGFAPGAFDARFELLTPAYLALGERAELPAPIGAETPFDEVIGIGGAAGRLDLNRPSFQRWTVELSVDGEVLTSESYPFSPDARMDVDHEGFADVTLWSSQIGVPVHRIEKVRLSRGELTSDLRLTQLRTGPYYDWLTLDVRRPDGKPATEGEAILTSRSVGSRVGPVVWATGFGSGPLAAPIPKAAPTSVDAEIWSPGCFRARLSGLTQSQTVQLEPGGEVRLELPESLLEKSDLWVLVEPTTGETFDDWRVDVLEPAEGGFRGHLSLTGEWLLHWHEDSLDGEAYLGTETIVVERVPGVQTFELQGPGN